jgi:glycosyltransferase involved in cell wall biosynthesis
MRILQVIAFPRFGNGSAAFAQQVECVGTGCGHEIETYYWENLVGDAHAFLAFGSHPAGGTRLREVTQVKLLSLSRLVCQRLTEILGFKQFDAVLLHHLHPIWSEFLTLSEHPPVALYLHGTEFHQSVPEVLSDMRNVAKRNMLLRVVTGCRWLVANSQWTSTKFQEQFNDCVWQLHIVEPGVDTSVFHPGICSTAYHSAPTTIHLVTAGRPVWFKRHEFILKAAVKLGEEPSKAGMPRTVVLSVFGHDGAHIDKALSAPLHVRYRGWQTQECLAATYREPGVVFVSAAVDEPFGLAWAEAACCGCPTVVSDRGGHLRYAKRHPGIQVFNADCVDSLASTCLAAWRLGRIDGPLAHELFAGDKSVARLLSILSTSISFG